jgi:hypothetical protein
LLRFQLGERRRLLSFDGRFLAAFHRVLRPHSEVLGPVDGPNPANLVQTTRFVGKVTCPQKLRTKRNANGNFGPRLARMAPSPRAANAIN